MNKISKIVEDNIMNLNAKFRVSITYYHNNLKVDEYYYNAHEKCHLASVTKLFALFATLFHAQQNNLNLNSIYTLKKEDIIPGYYILGNLHVGIELRLCDICRLMVVGSDTFCYDIIFSEFLEESLNSTINSMIALDNTEIRYSILDINLLLLGLYDCKKQVTWGNIMEYMGEGGYAGNKDIRLNNYNYSTVYDMNVLLSGFLQNKLLANEYFDIAYETLTSQYEKSRIPYKLGSKYFTIGHQPGTIITSDFQDVINDCGYIIIDENTYVIINFLCDEVEEDEFIINRAISHISFEALNYYRTLLK